MTPVHSHPVSPNGTSDAIVRITELLAEGKWSEDELSAVGLDRQHLEEIARRMEAQLAAADG